MAFYSFAKIDKIPALYYLIIGQRSNGKTFGACRRGLEQYLKTGKHFAYIRRMDEMIKPKNLSGLLSPHYEWLEQATNGKYNHMVYRANAFYMARYAEDKNGNFVKTAQDLNPCCRTYAISTVETTKGVDHGAVSMIIFDEFITRQFYLANEWTMFQNLLSSIIRTHSRGAPVYMLANTVSKHCPYFRDMGLTQIYDMQQGTISVYKLGQTDQKIVVEYCSPSSESKRVSEYFAFDNPQLKMITTGAWEIAAYRHAPPQLSHSTIILTFFIVHDSRTTQGDIYMYNGYPLIFWHPKTTPIRDPDNTIIYMDDHTDGNPLHQVDPRSGIQTQAQQLIINLIRQRKSFFADNQTGEDVTAWLKSAVKSGNSVAV